MSDQGKEQETSGQWVKVEEEDSDGQLERVWMYPRASRGVWLLFADGFDETGVEVRVVRAFTIEPSDAQMHREAESLRDDIPDGLKITIFRVGMDVYDDDELEEVGC